jgi:hypothetical protein
MRIALAAAVMLLAGCAGPQHAAARYLLNESNTDGIQPGEIVGPMPTVVTVTVRRVQ